MGALPSQRQVLFRESRRNARMKLIQRIVSHVLKRGIDLYLTFGVAVAAVVLGFVQNISLEVTASVILAVLALITFNMLQDRARFERMDGLLSTLTPAANFIQGDVTELVRELVKTTKVELFILVPYGRTLRGRYEGDVVNALKRGVKLRVVVSKPGDDTLQMLLLRSHSYHNTESIKRDHESFEEHMVALVEQYGKESVQVKEIDYVPSFALYMSDPNRPNGHAYAFVTTFRSAAVDSIGFRASVKRDDELFEFINSQYENYWHAGELAEYCR
jgi:hypothetical protein